MLETLIKTPTVWALAIGVAALAVSAATHADAAEYVFRFKPGVILAATTTDTDEGSTTAPPIDEGTPPPADMTDSEIRVDLSAFSVGHNLILRLAGDRIELANRASGKILGSAPIEGLSDISIVGTSDDDTLTVDITGYVDQRFAGSFTYEGGGGADTLAVVGTGLGSVFYLQGDGAGILGAGLRLMLDFSEITNLLGSPDAFDRFDVMSGARLEGSIDGRGGADVLRAIDNPDAYVEKGATGAGAVVFSSGARIEYRNIGDVVGWPNDNFAGD